MSGNASNTKIVAFGQEVDLAPFPIARAIFTEELMPPAKRISPDEQLKQWAEWEEKAGEELAALIKNTKDSGGNNCTVSNLHLKRIAEKYGLSGGMIVYLFKAKWEGRGKDRTFNFNFTPRMFFAKLESLLHGLPL